MGPGTNILSNSASNGHLRPGDTPAMDALRFRHEMDAAMSRFLAVEVEVGHAFAKAATDARWTREVLHNRRLARRAYDTATRLMRQVRFAEGEAQTLARRLENLRLSLSKLGDPL